MTQDTSDDDYTPVTGILPDDLVDSELQWAAHFNGLTTINTDLNGSIGGGSPTISISRASSSGDHRNLTADDARQLADELRELDEQDSVLLRYFTADGRDDPQEMADSLEAAAAALETAERLNDDTVAKIRRTLHEEVR